MLPTFTAFAGGRDLVGGIITASPYPHNQQVWGGLRSYVTRSGVRGPVMNEGDRALEFPWSREVSEGFASRQSKCTPYPELQRMRLMALAEKGSSS
jgi:hypothetical protein